MAAYQLIGATDAQGVIREADGATIPVDPLNRDWAAYLAWKLQGGTPDAAPAPVLTTLMVDAQCAKLLAAGIADAATSKTWQCDPDSLTAWTALGATAGLGLLTTPPSTATYTLIPADNSTVTLTAAQVQGLTQRLMTWVTNMKLFARGLKNQILAGTPPASITVGWPTS